MQKAAKDGKIIIFKGWPRFLGAWRAGKMKNIVAVRGRSWGWRKVRSW